MNDHYFDTRNMVIRLASEPANEASLAKLKPLLYDQDIAREFWRNLTSPEWLPVLVAAGYFDTCPAAEQISEGGTRFPRWEAGDYLARIAGVVPQQVAAVLSRIETDNASVMRTLLNAATAMPVVIASHLIPAIVHSIQRGALVFNQRAASDLCVRLIEGHQVSTTSTPASSPRSHDARHRGGGPQVQKVHKPFSATF